jgi:hypothetical protein
MLVSENPYPEAVEDAAEYYNGDGDNTFSQEPTRARCDASPLLAQVGMFHRVPMAWIMVMDLNIQRDTTPIYGHEWYVPYW